MVFLYPSTETEADFDPPAPEQVMVKVLLPESLIVTSSFPDADLAPFQASEAEHDVALLEDQLRFDIPVTITDVDDAEIETLGAGASASVLAPPPPPQAESSIAKLNASSVVTLIRMGFCIISPEVLNVMGK
ncbi:MAG: Uncharacterised protein [Porticoccaceae bacterium UBA1117]|nr:MAG: Uncharacterised protein [Porticoccaceae bacterium UBA1117]